MDICGSGVYREIQVYVDGYIAGTTYAFPTIYTGGVNPYLWRPVSGIMSFDVPSRRFDISPFLHLLSDGKSHVISIGVLNNNPGGVWIIDATLLAYTSTSDTSTSDTVEGHRRAYVSSDITSSELFIYDSKAQVDVVVNTTEVSEDIFTFDTVGYHSYEIVRVMTLSDGSVVKKGVAGKLAMFNINRVIGDTTENTLQRTISIASSISTYGKCCRSS